MLAGLSKKNMETKPIKRKKSLHSDNGVTRAEYDFSKGVRGKHAAQYAAGTNVVVIILLNLGVMARENPDGTRIPLSLMIGLSRAVICGALSGAICQLYLIF
jgi:hypothetical protein